MKLVTLISLQLIIIGIGHFTVGHSQLKDSISSSKNALESSPAVVVRGVLGGRVLLPCDVSPPSSKDAPILVLFYVANKKTPIFSLDSRLSSLYSAHKWRDPEMEDRVDLQLDYGNQGLLLHKVRPEDEGLYRCRVDFKASPTRNTRVRLDVIEPPRHLLITSKWKDERVVSKVAGPFPERAQVVLSCQVMGGKPPPKVTWWHEGSLLDDIIETRTNQMTRNSLQLPPLSRGDLLKNLTCQAVNSNLTSPLSSTVSVDLAFPPTSVKIRNPLSGSAVSPRGQRVLVVSEAEKNPLQCEVEGSRPQAEINWDLDGTNVNDKFQTITSPQGISSGDSVGVKISSTLILVPEADDKDSLITCRAVNPQLPEEMLYDTAKLNVLYKPRLKLTEGKKINLDNVKEGNDIYFECQVDANPPADKIIWSRNGTPLQHNSSAGVLLSSSGTSLILQDITRFASGTYSCTAINAKGSTTSNTLFMNVKFVPVCSEKNGSTVGGGLQEMVKAVCKVHSHPPPTQFRWAFNSSRGLQDITHSPNVYFNDSNQIIQYRIQTTDDFGAFLCWASNPLGDMVEACVINVIPAAKPEPVSDCEILHNASIPGGQVSVRCARGWNGGLTQSFTLEVRKAAHINTKVLSALDHSSLPYFKVRDLQTGIEYLFKITASNARGTSEPVTLLYTVPGEVIAGLTHARTDPQKTLQRLMPWLAIILGVMVTLLISSFVVICIVRSRIKKKKKDLSKIKYFGESSKQGDSSLQQTSLDTLVKDKESISKCDSVSGYDECVGFKREEQPLGCPPPFLPDPRLPPNNLYYQRENEGLLGSSNEFYEEGALRRRDDLPHREDPHFLTFGMAHDNPSNSLGRASTLSSGSSTSRPTFRSSQSTVVFNPRWQPEDRRPSGDCDQIHAIEPKMEASL